MCNTSAYWLLGMSPAHGCATSRGLGHIRRFGLVNGAAHPYLVSAPLVCVLVLDLTLKLFRHPSCKRQRYGAAHHCSSLLLHSWSIIDHGTPKPWTCHVHCGAAFGFCSWVLDGRQGSMQEATLGDLVPAAPACCLVLLLQTFIPALVCSAS